MNLMVNILIIVGLVTLFIQLASTTSVRANSILGKNVILSNNGSLIYRIRHRQYKIWFEKSWPNENFHGDSIFSIVPGLNGEGISFKARNTAWNSHYYIRHASHKCVLEEDDGTEQFESDATWIPRNGLANPLEVSFESSNNPNWYMRHENSVVKIESKFRFSNSTFYISYASISQSHPGQHKDFPV